MDRISQIGEFIFFFLFSIFAGFLMYITIEIPFNKIISLLTKNFRVSTPHNGRREEPFNKIYDPLKEKAKGSKPSNGPLEEPFNETNDPLKERATSSTPPYARAQIGNWLGY
nr:uncharacterized protein LOC122273621 [Parasteatoda tepidariorum]